MDEKTFPTTTNNAINATRLKTSSTLNELIINPAVVGPAIRPAAINVLKTPIEIAFSRGLVASDKDAHIAGLMTPSPRPSNMEGMRRISTLVDNGKSKFANAKREKPRARKSSLPILSDRLPDGADTRKLEMDMTERTIPICV
jgi:hypothetical protein